MAALALETVEEVEAAAPLFFDWFEGISVSIFAVEYVLRIWSCTAGERYRRPGLGRLRYAVRPLVLIDLMAIAPAFMPFLGIDLRSARIVRVFRAFRIAKVTRHSTAMLVLAHVVKEKREQLLATVFVMFVLLILASSLIYFAERHAQPDYFTSIPAAVWWGISTLTGAGFEDIYPITAAGRFIAALVGVLGIGMFALPTGILGAGFVEVMERKGQPTVQCPKCGHEFTQQDP